MTKELFATHGNTLPLRTKDVILDVAQQHNYDLTRRIKLVFLTYPLLIASTMYAVIGGRYNMFMKIPK